MKKALWITKNLIVYIHDGATPNMHYNAGMLVASKQPSSRATFCVNPAEIKYLSLGEQHASASQKPQCRQAARGAA